MFRAPVVIEILIVLATSITGQTFENSTSWKEAVNRCYIQNQTLGNEEFDTHSHVFNTTDANVTKDGYIWIGRVITFTVLTDLPGKLDNMRYRCVMIEFKSIRSKGSQYEYTYDLSATNCSAELKSLSYAGKTDALLVMANNNWTCANSRYNLWTPRNYTLLHFARHSVIAIGTWFSVLNSPGVLNERYWVGMVIELHQTDIKGLSIDENILKCGYLDTGQNVIRYTDCSEDKEFKCSSSNNKTNLMHNEDKTPTSKATTQNEDNGSDTLIYVGVSLAVIVVIACLVLGGVVWTRKHIRSPLQLRRKLPTGGHSFSKQKLVRQDTVEEQLHRPSTYAEIDNVLNDITDAKRNDAFEMEDPNYDRIVIPVDNVEEKFQANIPDVVPKPSASTSLIFSKESYIPMDCGTGESTKEKKQADSEHKDSVDDTGTGYDTLEQSINSTVFTASVNVYGVEEEVIYDLPLKKESKKKSHIEDNYHHLTLSYEESDNFSKTVSQSQGENVTRAVQNPTYDEMD